jgi:hypothetical protein
MKNIFKIISEILVDEAIKKIALKVGETIENDKLRIHRYRTVIQVTDLTNAGKRGKKVDRFSLFRLEPYEKYPDLMKKIEFLGKEKDYKSALTKTKKALEEIKQEVIKRKLSIPLISFDEYTYKGVDIKPAGFKPIKVKGKGVLIEADYDSFMVKNTDDIYNEETCIPAIRGKKTSINQFYRWLKDNQNKVKSMNFSDVTKEMDNAGINYHRYCAMD